MSDASVGVAGRRGGGDLRGRLRDPVWIFYGVAAVLLVAFGVSLVVRPVGHTWSFIDTWLVDAFEVAMALACLAGARRKSTGRASTLALGLGLLSWALGDVVWSFNPTSSVSVADAFYLAMYPLACVALLLLVRSFIGRFQANVWLDGLIAGLGAAAVCAAFAFDTIINSCLLYTSDAADE